MANEKVVSKKPARKKTSPARSAELKKLEQLINSNRLMEAERMAQAFLNKNKKDIEALNYYSVIAFKAGKLPDALKLAEQAVDLDAKHAQSLGSLGYFKRLAGQFDEAAKYLQKAAQLEPDNLEHLNNLGIVHYEQGKAEKAISTYEKAIQLDPKRTDVLNNLANALVKCDRFDAALEAFDLALSISPDYAQAWSNKGETILRHNALEEGKRQQRYAQCVEKAASLAPNWPEAQFKYANLLFNKKQLDKAEEILRQNLCNSNLVNLTLQHVSLTILLARLLNEKFELDEALVWVRQALILQPDNVLALQMMADICLRAGRPVEAIEIYKKAISLKPDIANLYYGLGNSLMRLERVREAVDCYTKVGEMDKNNARSVFASAACLLLNGEYEKGWAAYDARLKVNGFKPNIPDITKRLWDGSPLKGRHLLVHVEQGYGDTFQFCRYLEILREREGKDCKISFLCEPETFELMQTIKGPDQVLSLGKKQQLNYELQIPLLSLPHRMGTTLQTVPTNIPYLKVPAQCKASLKHIAGTHLKVGVVWAGRPTHSDDRYRSIDINLFSRLFELREIAFYSLQGGKAAKDVQKVKSHSNLVDASMNFTNTAGLIDQLDLVIAVDTSIAHLAGALGKPVWTLVAYGSEWRWLLHHERTPWYPNMRLYRQKICGDWGHVMDRVRQHLDDVLAEKTGKAGKTRGAGGTDEKSGRVGRPEKPGKSGKS